jgi:PhnB protein
MSSKVKAIPEDQQTVTPYLAIKDAASALDFYEKAFGAKVLMRLAEPGGRIAHAEMQVGKAIIMLCDEYPDLDHLGPQSRGGSTVVLHLLVEDVDAFLSRAAAAGAITLNPVKDEFYGERTCKLSDPFGHVWMIATRTEELSAEEVEKRYEDLLKQ